MEALGERMRVFESLLTARGREAKMRVLPPADDDDDDD